MQSLNKRLTVQKLFNFTGNKGGTGEEKVDDPRWAEVLGTLQLRAAFTEVRRIRLRSCWSPSLAAALPC